MPTKCASVLTRTSPVGYRTNGASRNQKKKIKSARKVAEHVLSNAEGTQRIRKGFLCDALCAFPSLHEIFAFWDLNFHFLPKSLCSNVFIECLCSNTFVEYCIKSPVSYKVVTTNSVNFGAFGAFRWKYFFLTGHSYLT